VRAYLVCIDELTVLGEIFSKKLDFFKRLQSDCDLLEQQDKGAIIDNPDGETETERIAFAQHMMEESRTTCTRLTADLRESLNSVCFWPLALSLSLFLSLSLSTIHIYIYA